MKVAIFHGWVLGVILYDEEECIKFLQENHFIPDNGNKYCVHYGGQETVSLLKRMKSNIPFKLFKRLETESYTWKNPGKKKNTTIKNQ